MLWDRVEPSGYTKYLRQDMLPGTPAHEVLMRAAVGDHQVTTLGAHIMARAVGAKHVDSGVRDVPGLEKVPGAQSGRPTSNTTSAFLPRRSATFP